MEKENGVGVEAKGRNTLDGIGGLFLEKRSFGDGEFLPLKSAVDHQVRG
jgi:hypothetical protein